MNAWTNNTATVTVNHQ